MASSNFGQQPSRIMSAREALNVVAFGVAAAGDMTAWTVLQDRWAVPLNAHDRHAQLLTVFRMLTAGECSREAWPEADLSDPYATGIPGISVFERLHATATTLLTRYGMTPAAAAAELEAFLIYHDAQERKIEAASGNLVQALSEGWLTVSAAVKSPHGSGASPADHVPAVRFRTIGVRVWASGEITFQDGSGYVSATFERAEVLRLWPLPIPAQPGLSEGKPRLSYAATRDFILTRARRAVEGGTLPIATEVIAACMDAGASKRQAEAIWREDVPREWKRPRGGRNQISRAKSTGD